MRRPFVFTLHFFLVVGLASTAFGLGYDVPKGATVGRGVEWPNGFHEILDQPNRVHGYVFNQYESYFYQGSAAELNKTLKRLAATSGLELKVLVGVGPGEARSPWSKKPVAPANWAIDFENNHKVKSLKTTLTIWTGGGLRFDDLNIPATIKLKRYDVPKGAAVKRAVEWPKGLYEILEQPNRVHGYVLDQGEEYFYQGSAAELNKVLKQLSAMGGLELEVLIGVGVGQAKSPWSKERVAAANWAISIEIDDSCKPLETRLTIWTEGGLRFEDLSIPASIKVKNLSTKDQCVPTSTRR